jgi:hypothetical protein
VTKRIGRQSVALSSALSPFVSSEVETPIDETPSPMGISTSLDANGLDWVECPLPIETRQNLAGQKAAFLIYRAMIYPRG